MPRVARQAPGGLIYHVLNKASGKRQLFRTKEDYLTFEQVLLAAQQRMPTRVLGWCIMPNHWHLVLWPKRKGELSNFMRWMTLTHAQRWKHAHGGVGNGHLYQGRFKSFPVAADENLLTLMRYIERNPVRAKLAKRPEQWRWSSCHVRQTTGHELRSVLARWPVDRPNRWRELLQKPESPAEEALMKTHIQRNRPLGSDRWVQRIAKELNLHHTLRPQGRPVGWRKPKKRRGKSK